MNRHTVGLGALLAALLLWIAIYPAKAQKPQDMQQQKTSGYAPVNGLHMYYEIYGSGAMPVVLIHGGGSTIQTTFGNILPLLAAHYKIIAVELQAHGRTSDRGAPESFEQDARMGLCVD